jgi:hypothetical protein
MARETDIKLFENKQIRIVWNKTEEEWYFSVVDVVSVLTDSPRPRKYWNALKTKLNVEGSEVSQNMGQLKLLSEDGKMRLTDVASTEQIFRIIQSIPSPKAEPFKQWLAHVAKQRLDQLQDPELSIEQAIPSLRRREMLITPCKRSATRGEKTNPTSNSVGVQQFLFTILNSYGVQRVGSETFLPRASVAQHGVINIKLRSFLSNPSSQEISHTTNLIPLFIK